MPPLVKWLLAVSALVAMTMLLYDQSSRGYGENEPAAGPTDWDRKAVHDLLNSSGAYPSSSSPLHLSSSGTLTDSKLKLVSNLTVKELEDLILVASGVNERRPKPTRRSPQVGIGRRSAPPKPGKVSSTLLANTLEKVKLRLLEDVSGVSYEDLLQSVMAGRPANTKPRPAPVKVVIVSTWRSGSTFLEELLGSHPAVFDIYEPLLMFDLKRLRDGKDAQDAQKILKNLLECKYQDDSYMAVMKKIKNMMERNKELYGLCSSKDHGTDVCYNLKFLSTACSLFPWTLMKLVRLKLELMRPFLESNETSSGLEIIYLVRDPRAVINSRRSTVGWCKQTSSDCYSPAVLCQDMEDDLQSARDFQRLFPGRVHILRYEDMASDPFNQTRKILDAVNLDFGANMEEFLKDHTTKNVDKPWSTSRESKQRLMYWTHKLPWSDVVEVQDACSATMYKFGYRPVNSLDNLNLDDVLGDFPYSL